MGSTRNSCRLLLDVGGTFLKSAVADAAGQLLSGSEFSCPIRSEGSREEIEGSLAAAVARGAAFAAERGMERYAPFHDLSPYAAYGSYGVP